MTKSRRSIANLLSNGILIGTRDRKKRRLRLIRFSRILTKPTQCCLIQRRENALT